MICPLRCEEKQQRSNVYDRQRAVAMQRSRKRGVQTSLPQASNGSWQRYLAAVAQPMPMPNGNAARHASGLYRIGTARSVEYVDYRLTRNIPMARTSAAPPIVQWPIPTLTCLRFPALTKFTPICKIMQYNAGIRS